eukprot:scaffold2517_cov97-Amphora_coffeaeformis.AAC.1
MHTCLMFGLLATATTTSVVVVAILRGGYDTDKINDYECDFISSASFQFTDRALDWIGLAATTTTPTKYLSSTSPFSTPATPLTTTATTTDADGVDIAANHGSTEMRVFVFSQERRCDSSANF